MTDQVIADDIDVEAVEMLLPLTQDVAVREEPAPPAVVMPESVGPVQQVLGAIIRAAADPTVDVVKMRELLVLQKELMGMQAEQQFTEAFQRLSKDIPRVKKNGEVWYKNKETRQMEKSFSFATWDAIDAAIRPLLELEGFTLSFDTSPRQGDGGGIVVTGTLAHVGGHKRTASIPLALDSSGGKNNIQGMGSTFSYGKRYTTTMLLNIVTEDDDDGKRAGTQYIDAAQTLEIQSLAIETKTDETRFLEMMTSDARSFEEIETKDYPRLLNALISKKRQMAKRAPPEKTNETV